MPTLPRNRAAAWWNPSRWITEAIVGLLVMSWAKRLAFIAIAGAALMGLMSVSGHGLKGWSLHLWGAGGLPMSAAERAPLFTQSWAAHDQAGMLRFVAPAEEVELKAWIAANPVPVAVADIAASDRQAKTISVEKDDTDGAVVKVRVSSDAAASDDPKAGGAFVQRQVWTYSGGHWFFYPEVAPPDAAVQRGVASSPANSRPNAAASAAYGPTPQPSYSRAGDKPPSAPVSRNVVIPSTVPPWARAR